MSSRPALTPEAEYYRQLAEQVVDYSIILLDRRGVIASWNEGARMLKGWTADEAIGQSFAILYTPEDRARGEPQRQLAVAQEMGRFITEQWCARKDGSRFWVSSLLTPLRSAGGEVVGFGKVSRDLSVRVRMEQERRDLYELIAAAQDAIIVRDLEARIQFWNRGAEALYGYRPDEAVGKIAYHLLRTRFPEPLESILRTMHQKGIWEGELLHQCKDGREIVVNSRWVRRGTPDSPEAIMEVNRDITSERRSYENMKRTGEDLETVTHAVGHDLRAPLRAIEGYAHFVAERMAGKLDDETRRMLDRIPEAAAKLDALVRDLISFSELAGPRQERVRVDLSAALKDAVAGEHPEELVVRGPLADVVGDRALVTQILAQLMSNAVKFRNPSRRLRVDVWTEKRDDGFTRLCVRDNGVGIPEEMQNKVFRPFERLSGKSSGSGMGLTVVARAALRLGGRVGVLSKPDEGSLFWVDLPGVDDA